MTIRGQVDSSMASADHWHRPGVDTAPTEPHLREKTSQKWHHNNDFQLPDDSSVFVGHLQSLPHVPHSIPVPGVHSVSECASVPLKLFNSWFQHRVRPGPGLMG